MLCAISCGWNVVCHVMNSELKNVERGIEKIPWLLGTGQQGIAWNKVILRDIGTCSSH